MNYSEEELRRMLADRAARPQTADAVTSRVATAVQAESVRRSGRHWRGVLLAAAAVAVVASYGSGAEGTVVAKNQDADDYVCGAGGGLAAPSAFPVIGGCADPACWQLVVRGSDGTVSTTCVSREEYADTRVGAFWHGRTDR